MFEVTYANPKAQRFYADINGDANDGRWKAKKQPIAPANDYDDATTAATAPPPSSSPRTCHGKLKYKNTHATLGVGVFVRFP
ncbi:MAG: hypothetical protein FWE21_10730 [Defluviitaleaceae bacterium]|nr:hypothetical protein [Defluviitaleaceae bacterium]